MWCSDSMLRSVAQGFRANSRAFDVEERAIWIGHRDQECCGRRKDCVRNWATIANRLHLRWCLRQNRRAAGKTRVHYRIGLEISHQNREREISLPGAVGWGQLGGLTWVMKGTAVAGTVCARRRAAEQQGEHTGRGEYRRSHETPRQSASISC